MIFEVIKNLFRKEVDPFQVLIVDYEILIRAARRCAYDLCHAADYIPSDEFVAAELRERGQHWAELFAKGNPGKDYRNQLHHRINELATALEKANDYCKKNPDKVPVELRNLLCVDYPF